MTVFSLIVPIYRVEKYVAKCLESILSQTLEDFEVLCVDDCGGDNSIDIVEEYAKKDCRIRILYQPKNKGVAAARNLALDNAKGKYIFCVDSDDWIEANTLMVLKNAFEKSDCTSVWFNGYSYFEKTNSFSEKPYLCTKNEIIHLSPENVATYPDMCGMKAYTRESIQKINLHWPEDIKFDEDGEFYFKYYSYYNRVCSIDDCLYTIRRHEGSAVANFNAGKTSCEDLFKVLKHLKDFYLQRGIYEDYKITLLKLLENRINMCKKSSYSESNKILALDLINYLNFPEDFEKFNRNKTPLVSIVVPVYNVELYIQECLKSMISQTYNNIEILCVDDCGQDNSVKIVKQFAKEDSRIKLIRHNKNKGLGGARNTGLKHAKGEYVLFIDSDDWISKDCVEIVVDRMKTTGLNSVWFKAEYWLEDSQKKAPMDFCSYYMNMNEGYFLLNENNIANFPVVTWNKAYRTEFLKENKLSWRENIIYEDVEFYWQMFTKSPQIYIIDKFMYFYRQRSDSIMHANANSLDKPKTSLFVLSQVGKYLKKNKLFDIYKPAYYKFLHEILSNLYAGKSNELELKRLKLEFLKSVD